MKMKNILVLVGLLGLAACNNPAEKTLFQAASALEQNNVEAFEAQLVNRIAIKHYYTQEEVFSYYAELLTKFEDIKVEDLAKDPHMSPSHDTINLVASITAKPILARFSYRNGRDDQPGGDIRTQPRLGEREIVRHVKFICEKSNNKFGYENCLIASFSRYSTLEAKAGESFSDGIN